MNGHPVPYKALLGVGASRPMPREITHVDKVETITGTFTVHQHLEKRCPHCLSGWIRNRYNTRWDCRNCKGWFDKPVTALLCVAA